MAYIGREPVIGNFVKLDAITAVNGQAAYTMQNGGSNFTDYESVNQFLVSLNGTIQSPGSSFSVSSSTITFSSNLVTNDVIDFIMVFGNSLSAGTPTDATVTTAKLSGALVTPSTLDINGNELILDVDADTSITADTDDQIDFKTGGTDAATIDSSANLKFNSGFGSVSTAFGCRAWVRFDGTGTASINGSGNVSSLTDQGVGNIDVNFTNNMPDGNYCVSLSLGRGLLATGNQQFPITVPTVGNVGYFETASRQCDNDNNTFAAADADQICASVFR